jgi:hypothetical protein
MTDRERRPLPYQKAQIAFEQVPEEIRFNLFEALNWALETLKSHEGDGHLFEICYQHDGFVASFAKPQWNADHTSQPMNTAQEAIVMAVCEYLNGV